jgi:predicted nucleotidyltransferase
MKIEKGQMIAGQPVLKVRDFFKRNERFGIETAAYFFNLSNKAAKTICLEFTELGYCERVPPKEMVPAYRKEIRYELLPLGRSLALARAVPPITRQKAERIVQEFMDRVEEINSNEKYVYKITKVLLFGSYIRPDATELNDVDIAVEIAPKYRDPDVLQKKNDAYIQAAIEGGRHFRDWLDQMFAPQTDVKTFLRNKSRYVSLHTTDDGVLKETETKQIYPQLMD